MNTNKIKEIAHSSKTAELMFQEWSTRQRHRGITDLSRYKTHLQEKFKDEFNVDDYYKTMETLAAEGVGQAGHVVRGRPKYFYWKTSVRDVGHVGVAGELPQKGKREPKKAQQMRKLYIMTQAGTLATVLLPNNLSRQDYITLGQAISQLGTTGGAS